MKKKNHIKWHKNKVYIITLCTEDKMNYLQ